MAKLASKTYGDALFELALEENRLDEFVDEVTAVVKILDSNADLTKLMNHPKVDKEEKIQVIENIFEGKVSKELVGLMRMVIEKGRTNELIGIFEYFIAEYKEHKNIGTAYVTTAIELNPVQKEQVEKRLLETTKYVKIEVSYSVDKSLIGGMVIRIGDRVMDSSIKTRLYELTKDLTQIQLVS